MKSRIPDSFTGRQRQAPALRQLVALLLVLAVSGCGGGGSSGGSSVSSDASVAPPPTPPMVMANNLTGLPGATLMYPAADGRFDESQLFQWSAVQQVQGYRLQIGSAAGQADVYDSGEIAVTRVRAPGLPTGTVLAAQLATIYPSGEIAVAKFSITVTGQDSDLATRLALAKSVVLDVRNMAGENNVPVAGSILESVVQTTKGSGATYADCGDYSSAMLLMITQMNLGVQARKANTCLVPNRYDCHTLVELFDATQGRWFLADPTFGLALHNAADGSGATLDDMRNATRSQNWNAITYEYLTATGESFAGLYYLDYPLLFVNTYISDSDPMALEGPVDPDTVSKFYQAVGSLAAPGKFGPYALQCGAGAAQASATVDGTSQSLDCDPTLGITHVFLATTVDPQDGAVLLSPIRVVFPGDAF
jgi:hypothetical protein